MGFYSPQSLVADARRHGVRVLRADVQASQAQAVVERAAGIELSAEGGGTAGEGRAAGIELSAHGGGEGFGDVPRDAESGRALVDPHPELAVRLGLAPVRGVGEETAERQI